MAEYAPSGGTGTDQTDRSADADRSDPSGQPTLAYLLAGLLAGAGIIHLAMVPAHVGGDTWLDPVAFAVVGWLQVGLAVLFLLRRGTAALFGASVVLNLAVLGLWVWSITAGLPVGAHAGIVEEVSAVSGVSAGLEVAAVLVAVVLLAVPDRARIGVVFPSVAAVAVLGLATVAITSPDAASHGGHDHGEDAAGEAHGHGTDAAHLDEMAAIARDRCDLGFNPASYWSQAPRMGVDVYAGGAMSPHDDRTMLEQAGSSDVFEGRGSVGLDTLIQATDAAAGGEVAAAQLVTALADASDADHEAWMEWMGRTAAGSGGHDHGASAGPSASAAAPDDNGGHGGHAGPQPWVAMVDQGQCVRLAEELELARETALSYPTAADATAAGWVRVTPYVPGIAAHYMNFGLVDGTFRVEEPEMILYDGNGPDARVVGLSYYLLHSGDAEPSQGFTGANDHYHRHVGLCNKPGAGVIGDSTTTEEECRALGGFKSNDSRGWMSHAWVVPGCESPWGVFSGASPLLEGALPELSGTDDGACAGSSVRDRYDLRPGGPGDGPDPTGDGESASGD
jgi:hypothetical protein